MVGWLLGHWAVFAGFLEKVPSVAEMRVTGGGYTIAEADVILEAARPRTAGGPLAHALGSRAPLSVGGWPRPKGSVVRTRSGAGQAVAEAAPPECGDWAAEPECGDWAAPATSRRAAVSSGGSGPLSPPRRPSAVQSEPGAQREAGDDADD